MPNGVINVNLQIFSALPQHLRPGHELQQHRSFSSTADDDETSGGKKSDKHKKPTTGGEWEFGKSWEIFTLQIFCKYFPLMRITDWI